MIVDIKSLGRPVASVNEWRSFLAEPDGMDKYRAYLVERYGAYVVRAIEQDSKARSDEMLRGTATSEPCGMLGPANYSQMRADALPAVAENRKS
jgi:hypothetical protein